MIRLATILRHGAALFAVLAVSLLVAPRLAAADNGARCQVYEIEAKKEGSLHPSLKGLASKLGKPPFSSWKGFDLLKKHDQSIEQMKAYNVKLVPGGKLSLLYRDRSEAEGKKPRLRLGFTLDDASGKRKLDGTIKLDSGDYYLIGGDELPSGGTYILAVSCSVK